MFSQNCDLRFKVLILSLMSIYKAVFLVQPYHNGHDSVIISK